MQVKYFLPIISAAFLALFCGCTSVSIAEALQMQEGAPVYTQYNIWYTDPANVSSLNIQEGRILPIGTEVTPIKATDKKLVFIADGVEFTVKFDSEALLMPMEMFIERLLTMTPPEELLKDVSEASKPYVLRGSIVPGMTRREVILACGYPPPGRTPNLNNNAYLYYQSSDRTFRVVFSGDVVREIIEPRN